MRNLKNIFVVVVFAVALYSCDSEVTIDDPKSDTEITTKTGNQGNEVDDRDNG